MTRLLEKIKVYHYTNPKAYKSMKDGSTYGKKGLLSIRRFVKFGQARNLPEEAYEGTVRGILKPEPKSWTENPKYPNLWRYLIGDLLSKDESMLLSFDVLKSDKAYMVERAHVENELYKESKGKGKSTRETLHEAYKKYWESRIPIFEYDEDFSVPEINIWNTISFDRLKVEWIKPHNEVWQRIKNNGW